VSSSQPNDNVSFSLIWFLFDLLLLVIASPPNEAYDLADYGADDFSQWSDRQPRMYLHLACTPNEHVALMELAWKCCFAHRHALYSATLCDWLALNPCSESAAVLQYHPGFWQWLVQNCAIATIHTVDDPPLCTVRDPSETATNILPRRQEEPVLGSNQPVATIALHI
jgi:hypothetical protein